MTRRAKPPATPETDADKVVEALRVVSGTLENVASELSMLNDTVDRIRDELKWLTTNHLNVRIIDRLPLNPSAQNWPEQLTALNPEHRDMITCGECDAQIRLAVGVREGWTEVAAHQYGFIGLCPEHQESEQAESPAKPAKVQETTTVKPSLSERPTVQCDVCSRQVSQEEAKCDGWKDVARWQGGGHAAFLGLCPTCAQPAPKPKSKTLFPPEQ